MATSAPDDWNGIALAYSVDTGSTWTSIAMLKDLSFSGMDVTDIELTTNDDTWKQFVPGTQDPGEITATIAFDPADDLEDHLGVLMTTTHITAWKVTWPDTDATIWRWGGYMKNFAPGGSLDNPLDASITIKLTGTPTFL